MSRRYRIKEDLLPNSKKIAIGTILKRSGIFKDDRKMRTYLRNGNVRVKGRVVRRAGESVKIDRNNIRVRVKGRGDVIIVLEEG